MKQKISVKQLIGVQARVISSNAVHEGEILSETKNTITINTMFGIKTLMKKHSVIFAPEKISGESILTGPQDRLKGA